MDLGFTLAVGGTRQELDISGLNIVTNNGVAVQNPGGFFSNEFIFYHETPAEAVARYKGEKTYLKTSALNSAIIIGSLEDAKILLEAGAETRLPNDVTGHLLTSPLILAATYGDVEIVKLLLKKGAPVNRQDQRGDTALHMASLTGRLELVKLLLDAGANPALTNKQGRTPAQLSSGASYLSEKPAFQKDLRWPMIDLNFAAMHKDRKEIRQLLKN